jgi:hypothetical protein
VGHVNVRGLVAAAFTHRDSRAGDPDLHTHVAVANKVQTLDGRCLPSMGGSCSKPPWLPRRPTAQPVLRETLAATARIMQHPSECHSARNFVSANTRQLMQLIPSCIVSQPMRSRYVGSPRQHVRRTRMS